jgi:Protein of unknown function (DUF2505)
MRLTARLDYPGAAPDRVMAMLTDPAFLSQVCAATGALRHDIDVAAAGGGYVVTTSRELPTDRVPELVRSLVGERLTVRRVDRWDAVAGTGRTGRTGRIEVTIAGTPVSLTGSLALSPAPSPSGTEGTTQLVDGDLNAAIPLLGSRIARAAEPAVRAAIEVEERVGRAWLAHG